VRGLRDPREIRLAAVFSPLKLTIFLYVPLLVLYVASSPTIFRMDFDSRKALTAAGLAFFALALATFAVGARLGARLRHPADRGVGGARELSPERRRSLAVLIETALVVSVGAYVLWFGRGILNAGGVLEFFDIWRSDPHRIKDEIMTSVPGATTLTQLAVAAIPLSIAYGLNRRGSAIRLLTVVILVLAAARALFVSERLAIVELIVPLVYVLVAPRKLTVPRVVVYAVTFVVAAMLLFAVTELRRTYVYTDNFSATRSATRFLGYYLTSVNNGMAVIDQYPGRTPFYSTGEMLWKFPGLAGLRLDHFPVVGTQSLAYADLFGVDPESFWGGAFADQGLSYEFNVFTAPGFLAADFGWAALVVLLLLGVVSGRLYVRADETPFHRAFYAVWLVGLFELMRILYFSNVRAFPAYLVFLAAYLVVRQRGVRERVTRALPSTAPGVRGR
jgi:oligosaccharide repeat unit polymerase